MKGKNIILHNSALSVILMALYSWATLFVSAPEQASLQSLMDIKNQLDSYIGDTQSIKKIAPPESGMYFGAFANFGPTEDEVTRKKINSFSALTHKKIAWAYFSNNWFTGIEFPSNEVQLLAELDITPYIRLMPRTDFRIQPGNSPYTLQRIRSGEYDEQLKVWAQAAKKSAVPILIEFGTEVNGKWFPWNGKWNGETYIDINGQSAHSGPQLFIETYRHIIDIFRTQQVDNVTWVYHVNALSSPDQNWNDLDAYYPGDDYIDWVGVSVYGAQSPNEEWRDFDSIYSPAYNKIITFSNKPIGIVELGVAEGAEENMKAQWLTQALGSLQQGKYPDTRAVSYWHSSWESEGVVHSLNIDSSAASAQSFKYAIHSDFFVSTTTIR